MSASGFNSLSNTERYGSRVKIDTRFSSSNNYVCCGNFRNILQEYDTKNKKLSESLTVVKQKLLQAERERERERENAQLLEKLKNMEEKKMDAAPLVDNDTKSKSSENDDILLKYDQNPTQENLYLVEQLTFSCTDNKVFQNITKQLIERIRLLETPNNDNIKNINVITIKWYKQELENAAQHRIDTHKKEMDQKILTLNDDLRTQKQLLKEQEEKHKVQVGDYQEQLLQKSALIAKLKSEYSNLENDTQLVISTANAKIDELNSSHASELRTWENTKAELVKKELLLLQQIKEIEFRNTKNLNELQIKYVQSLRIKDIDIVEKEKAIENAKQKIGYSSRVNEHLTKKIKNLETTNTQQANEMQKLHDEHSQTIRQKTILITQNEKEIENAHTKIKQLLQVKAETFKSLRNSTTRFQDALNVFTNAITKHTQCLSMNQIIEDSRNNSIKLRLDRISRIKQSVIHHEKEIESCNINDHQVYLHLKEILLRALENLDHVASNGNVSVQSEREQAIIYVRRLYRSLGQESI